MPATVIGMRLKRDKVKLPPERVKRFLTLTGDVIIFLNQAEQPTRTRCSGTQVRTVLGCKAARYPQSAVCNPQSRILQSLSLVPCLATTTSFILERRSDLRRRCICPSHYTTSKHRYLPSELLDGLSCRSGYRHPIRHGPIP